LKGGVETYLSSGPFRFQMRFEKGTFVEFYRASGEVEDILRERQKWLALGPSTYAAAYPESLPLLHEFHDLLHAEAIPAGHKEQDALQMTRSLGGRIEPDFLILKPAGKTVRLLAGCVCFPSSWALKDKIGREIEAIHEIVPTLNETIGGAIQQFLMKLKPGISWNRSNWGLSRSKERNHHPSRKLPRLDSMVEIEEVNFRVEEQSLYLLRETGGILFGIRIRNISLKEIKRSPEAAGNLIEQLSSMPAGVAEYKGLGKSRERIISLLKA
jgi:hypothetical protein